MPTRKVNARDFILQVLAADGTTWIGIGALNKIAIKLDDSEETVDTTTFDSAGNAESEAMQRGAALDLEGFALMDPTTGAQDPGQARCEVLATQTGYNSLGSVRFRYPAQNTWKNWTAVFSVGEQGGGTNDKGSWKCSITRSGASTTTSAP
ncbi:hypothetical protein GCM10010174_70150 [Kutzneria viridogrisea]|uniref:Phage tail tube protein n=1 Tax=Kutzneria viridogrisea TaxID=47990 RepID=A0ABR6BBA3_9PSEU|nr:hypothetical protein [Kutzneria viridogrisea]